MNNLETLKWMLNAIPDAAILVGPEQFIAATNARAAEIFGMTVESMIGAPLDILIPESSVAAHRQHVDAFFREPAKRTMGSGLRFRGRCADGSLLPVDIMLSHLTSESPGYTIAIIRDDSERAEMQALKEKLEATNLRLTRAQDAGGLAWWEADLRTSKISWSPSIQKILGMSRDDDISFTTMRRLCIKEDLAHFDKIHESLGTAAGEKAVYGVRSKGVDISWIEETIHKEKDHIVLGVLRDITNQKNLEERLRKESVTDELTGLYNRKQFNRDLKSRYSEFARTGSNASIITYDFDYFKTINDAYGHAMGDKVLRQAAALVTDQLRASDQAYRLGGEEFAILLGRTSSASAESLAERIRETISKADFRLADSVAEATVSLGVAEFRASDINFEQALKRADEALYQSKANTRNTVSVIR